MKGHLIRRLSLGLAGLSLALVFAACAGPAGKAGPAGPQGPAGRPGAAGPPGADGAPGQSFVVTGPGLKIKITGVEFPADGKPVVSLTLTDAADRPLSGSPLEGASFTIAQIVVDEATGLSKYQSLLAREVRGQPYTIGGDRKSGV